MAEGGAKIVWVFRVKIHDLTQKNHIFSNFRGGRAPGTPPPPLYPPLMWSCPGNMPKYYPGLRNILPDRDYQDHINIIIILSV